jgi:hypothetical protein
MKNIHVLPTDKPSRLIYNDANQLCYQSNKSYKNDRKWIQRKKFNIYITSDEEIKEERLRLIIDNREGMNGFIHQVSVILDSKICPEIILTTDQDLIKDGVQAIDNEFLEWFVKNPSCEWVEVIYDKDAFPYGVETAKGYGWYKIIIPQEEPKQETLEEAANKYVEDFDLSFYDTVEAIPVKELGKKDFIEGAKWQAKRMYSEEEVIAFTQTMIQQYKFGNTNIEQLDLLKESLEQFKKK